VREQLKQSLGEAGDIDFVGDVNGIRVYRNLQSKGKKTRRKELDLR
jgi:hypothetical protein